MAIRKSLLPSAYQQVEYIESSGSQYIDTQVKPTANMSSKIKLSFNSLTGIDGSDGQVLGCRFNNYRCYLLYLEAGQYWGYGKGNYYYATTPLPQTNNIYNVETILGSTNQNMILDGVSIKTSSDIQDISAIDYNLYLFAFNFGGVAQKFTLIKLYSCSIYSNDILVRNFIPCYRKSDSVIGLYDTVNGVFYTNAGTGTFTKGNDVMPKVKKLIKNNDYVVRAYKGSSLYYNALPSEFKAVEYIESSGTQYINTGIAPSLSTDALKITMKYETITNTFTNSDNMLFGSGTPSNNDCCYFVDATRNKNLYVRYYNDTASTTENGFFTTYASGKMVLDSNGISVNGSTPIATSTSGNTTNDLPIYIFARNGATTLNSSFKLYSFKMEKNGKIVRYFIPCYRISDTTIGLYDLVNGVFYTNAGTGTFTKGSDI